MSPAVRLRHRYVTSALELRKFRPLDFCCTECIIGTEGPFPGGKARPGRDADHSPQSSAEVEKEEIYLLSPKRLHGV
jgi:hypothetical protein